MNNVNIRKKHLTNQFGPFASAKTSDAACLHARQCLSLSSKNALIKPGTYQEALPIIVYEQICAMHGPESVFAATLGGNYALNLVQVGRFADARAICRDIVQWAHRNPDSPHSFHVLKALARSIYEDPNASAEDLREAVRVFENVPATSSRVFGPAHPDTKKYENILAKAKKALAEKSSA